MVIDTNIVIYILIALVVINIAWLIRIEIRLKKLFAGKKAKDLEKIILEIRNEIVKINLTEKETGEYLKKVEKRLKKSIQGVSTIRFNPFKGSGSNQSFTTALLNEKGDGVVISSLYSRERVSIFAKPLEKKGSSYELSKEEKEAIKTAGDKMKN